jgi:hypothetical protein
MRDAPHIKELAFELRKTTGELSGGADPAASWRTGGRVYGVRPDNNTYKRA